MVTCLYLVNMCETHILLKSQSIKTLMGVNGPSFPLKSVHIIFQQRHRPKHILFPGYAWANLNAIGFGDLF